MAAKEPLCSAVSMIRALRTPRVRIGTIDRNGSEEAVMVYHANDVQILAGPLALRGNYGVSQGTGVGAMWVPSVSWQQFYFLFALGLLQKSQLKKVVQ